MTNNQKEEILERIEHLLKKSFYEGENDEDVQNNNSLYKFALEYPLRSKCYYSIGHLMQYIEMEIDKVS